MAAVEERRGGGGILMGFFFFFKCPVELGFISSSFMAFSLLLRVANVEMQ